MGIWAGAVREARDQGHAGPEEQQWLSGPGTGAAAAMTGDVYMGGISILANDARKCRQLGADVARVIIIVLTTCHHHHSKHTDIPVHTSNILSVSSKAQDQGTKRQIGRTKLAVRVNVPTQVQPLCLFG